MISEEQGLKKIISVILILLVCFWSPKLGVARINSIQSFPLYLSQGETFSKPLNQMFYSTEGQLTYSIRPNTGPAKLKDDVFICSGIKDKGFDAVSIIAQDVEGATAELALPVFYAAKKYRYHFVYEDAPGKNVYVAGEFNGWNSSRDKLRYTGKYYEAVLELRPGRYQYKFVVDGNWIPDPKNDNKVRDPFGGYNSLAIVGSAVNRPPKFVTYERNDTRVSFLYLPQDGGTLKAAFAIVNNRWLKPKIVDSPRGQQVILSDRMIAIDPKVDILVFGIDEKGNTSKILSTFIKNDKNYFSWRDAVIYFAMTDRFYNGDVTNDSPIKDPDLSYKGNYQGGDWAGLIKKIQDGYFNDLGVNVLWISPANDNPEVAYRDALPPHRKFSGYHGYWPISTTRVEEHFGTASELKKLVGVAHKHGLKVMLDFVANHMHKDSKLYKQHPEYFGAVMTADGETNIRLFDKYPLTTWFDWFLPSFDYVHSKKAVEVITDNALYWIKKYGFDAFREDAVKHIPHNFWRALKAKLLAKIELPQNKHFLQIGETIDSREKIEEYVGPFELDGQFDFPLYWAIRDVFAFGTRGFKDLESELAASQKVYGDNPYMSVFLGNHDFSRFISYAAGDVRPGQNEKEIGWNNPPKVPAKDVYEKAVLAFGFVLTQPRIPLIYYGDEIGLPGAGDPDNRRMMQFSKLKPQQKYLRDYVKQLLALRKKEPAIRYGRHISLIAERDYYVYANAYFQDVIIVAMNKDKVPQNVTIQLPESLYPHKQFITLLDTSKNSADRIETSGHTLSITLQPHQLWILKGI